VPSKIVIGSRVRTDARPAPGAEDLACQAAWWLPGPVGRRITCPTGRPPIPLKIQRIINTTTKDRFPRFRAFFLLTFLSIIWAYTVYGNGGMGGWDRQLYLLALGVLALAWRITVRPLNEAPPPIECCLGSVPAAILCVAPAYPAAHQPAKVLSPARVELQDALRPVMPGISSRRSAWLLPPTNRPVTPFAGTSLSS